MRFLRLASPVLLIAICLQAPLPAKAQAPVCAGISDISDFDGPAVSDLDGSLHAVRVATGLLRPVLVTAAPGDASRVFIVEQDGKIKLLRNGAVLADPFLDLGSFTRSPADGGGNEEGLLGLAFHPGYDGDGTRDWAFVYHTDTTGANNLIARYGPDPLDPDRLDPASRKVMLTIPHPTNDNHNAGMIAFSPQDGYLYVATGDGGSSCDPPNNAQNLGVNLGKLLRLDVNTDKPSAPFYDIPAGNPFVGIAGNDEIWSFGLRNPWRWSFDRVTSAIYIGDVGQGQREEIDCVPASGAGGENYGWDRYEGTVCPNPSCGSQGSCSLGSSYVPPVQEYTHTSPAGSCSVTGGYVYRGCRMGDLHGTYFYADYCSDFIRSFRTGPACAAPAPLTRTTDLAPGGGLGIVDITSFGEDARGEIYIVERGGVGPPPTGEIFKIIPSLRIAETSATNAPPLLLTDGDDWSWEDLAAAASTPVDAYISAYKVYRSAAPAGPFICTHQSTAPSWAGGDPAVPAAGGCFFYLVTARDSSGEETRPGSRSDGTPRTVDTGSICPP